MYSSTEYNKGLVLNLHFNRSNGKLVQIRKQVTAYIDLSA